MPKRIKAVAQHAPLVLTFNRSVAADWIDGNAFTADRDYELLEVSVVWTTASSSGTLMLDRCQGTEAAGSGDNLLTSTVDLSTTADTVTRPSLTTTTENRNIYRGNRIALDFGGTVTNGVGLAVTVVLAPTGVNLRAY